MFVARKDSSNIKYHAEYSIRIYNIMHGAVKQFHWHVDTILESKITNISAGVYAPK